MIVNFENENTLLLSQGAKGNYLIIFGLILEKTLPSPCGRGAGGEGFSDFENALLLGL